MAEGVSVHLGPQHGQFLFDMCQFILQTEDDLPRFDRSRVVIMPPVFSHGRRFKLLYIRCVPAWLDRPPLRFLQRALRASVGW